MAWLERDAHRGDSFFVDSIDQFLLLIGRARARKHPNRSHPLGYGMETFWSFIVAVMVMLAGGFASI